MPPEVQQRQQHPSVDQHSRSSPSAHTYTHVLSPLLSLGTHLQPKMDADRICGADRLLIVRWSGGVAILFVSDPRCTLEPPTSTMTAKAPTTALRDEPAFLSDQSVVSSPRHPARSYDPESTSHLVNFLFRLLGFCTMIILGTLMFLSPDEDTDTFSIVMFGLASVAWAFLAHVTWAAWRKRVKAVKREQERVAQGEEEAFVGREEGADLLERDELKKASLR